MDWLTYIDGKVLKYVENAVTVPNFTMKSDKIVIAKYSMWNKWLRALVLSVNIDRNEVNVSSIDYGHELALPTQCIFPLLDIELATVKPFSAISDPKKIPRSAIFGPEKTLHLTDTHEMSVVGETAGKYGLEKCFENFSPNIVSHLIRMPEISRLQRVVWPHLLEGGSTIIVDESDHLTDLVVLPVICTHVQVTHCEPFKSYIHSDTIEFPYSESGR